MSFQFGWVDFSEEDRRRMTDVIRLFSESETRDELGIGAIRDTFSNLLFPGTSTIQRRVKYMLFVPWQYLWEEEKKTSSKDIAGKARGYEIRLIRSLAESDDQVGIIGVDAGKTLQRLPSEIYWSGLGSWGIRRFDGSRDQYHRWLDTWHRRSHSNIPPEGDDPERDVFSNNWDSNLPPRPDGFPYKAQFDLSREEAEYLQDRILSSHPKSLLAYLISEKKQVGDISPVWAYLQHLALPDLLKQQVEHARNFAEIIYGAALLYNLMLAQKSGPIREEEQNKYQEKFQTWATGILRSYSRFREWGQDDFWQLIEASPENVTSRTKNFVVSWIDLTMSADDPQILASSDRARNLIFDRERMLKRNRARLNSDNKRALENWSGASGVYALTYRWEIARSAINDIVRGLKGRK